MAQTGPFSRQLYKYWQGTTKKEWDYNITWYRNGPGPRVPHILTLARSRSFSNGQDCVNASAGYYANQTSPPSWWSSEASAVHNKCYAKFKQEAYDSAALGVDLAEFSSSANMIRNRAGQLFRAARALKTGRFFEFLHQLGIPLRGRLPRRSDPKKAANLWLEYHFGWSPLLGDIHDACKVLEGPTRNRQVQAKASSGRLTYYTRFNGSGWYDETSMEGYLRELMGAQIVVTNPQLHRATQLGLTNPATVLWEIVPFSFVVDWFVPVGPFLESYSDWFGIQLKDPYTTISRRYYSIYRNWSTSPTKRLTSEAIARGWRVARSLSISGPTIYLRPWSNGQLKSDIIRAATSISVLVQQLKRLPSR